MLIKTDMSSGKSYILSGTYNGRSYNALNDISTAVSGAYYIVPAPGAFGPGSSP